MLEPTRELIEHYLRATGWTLSDGEWLKQSDDAGYQHFSAEWIDSVGGLSLDVVVRMTGHSAKLSTISFQLGICAAAEHMIIGYTHPPTVAMLRLESNHLINLVGIDPKAWEAARKQ